MPINKTILVWILQCTTYIETLLRNRLAFSIYFMILGIRSTNSSCECTLDIIVIICQVVNYIWFDFLGWLFIVIIIKIVVPEVIILIDIILLLIKYQLSIFLLFWFFIKIVCLKTFNTWIYNLWFILIWGTGISVYHSIYFELIWFCRVIEKGSVIYRRDICSILQCINHRSVLFRASFRFQNAAIISDLVLCLRIRRAMSWLLANPVIVSCLYVVYFNFFIQSHWWFHFVMSWWALVQGTILHDITRFRNFYLSLVGIFVINNSITTRSLLFVIFLKFRFS